jgi:nitrile hydratase
MTYPFHADLGGQIGHGPVTPEPEGELWHEAFEPKALALTLAMGATGAWNIDQSRSARETLPGYAQLSYYRIWLAGIERLMAERGLLGDDELAAGRLLHPAQALPRKLLADAVPAMLAKGSPTERPAPGPARFAVGDVVRTRAGHAGHHSRLPGYAQGKRGTITRLHGAHVFPDTNARGLGEQPQWLYTVVFDGAALWGAQAEPGLQVSVDAWDSYLQPDHGDSA